MDADQPMFNRETSLSPILSPYISPAIFDLVPPRKKSSNACDLCRRSKQACSGGPRCLKCSGRGLECTFSKTLMSKTRTVHTSIPVDSQHASLAQSVSPRKPTKKRSLSVIDSDGEPWDAQLQRSSLGRIKVLKHFAAFEEFNHAKHLIQVDRDQNSTIPNHAIHEHLKIDEDTFLSLPLNSFSEPQPSSLSSIAPFVSLHAKKPAPDYALHTSHESEVQAYFECPLLDANTSASTSDSSASSFHSETAYLLPDASLEQHSQANAKLSYRLEPLTPAGGETEYRALWKFVVGSDSEPPNLEEKEVLIEYINPRA